MSLRLEVRLSVVLAELRNLEAGKRMVTGRSVLRSAGAAEKARFEPRGRDRPRGAALQGRPPARAREICKMLI